MTEKELRKKIGIGDKDLIGSPQGLVDILGVQDDIVTLGYLAGGGIRKVEVETFLKGFRNASNC